jgi:phospholipase C
MSVDLSRIKTIVVVMMENRSFDNLLGYLCLDPHNWKNVEGLGSSATWQDKVASVYNATKYRPFLLTDPYDVIDADPPHERDPRSRSAALIKIRSIFLIRADSHARATL